MRFAVFALSAWLAAVSLCPAAPIGPPPATASVIRIDWQAPPFLPRKLRNHCYDDRWSGRPYCSDHCGYEYQAYYCAPHAFGCCRIGHGYCDWSGLLRCAP